MTTAQALPLALLAIAGTLFVLAGAIALRRVIRDHQTALRNQRLATVRPLLLRHLSDDEPDLRALDHVAGPEGRLLEELAWQMLGKVRGASRQALVAWLDRRGAIEEARLRTHKRGAVGRAKAAERLGAAGVLSTSPDVARLLEDPHAEVRIVAARALGKLGDASAVPALLKAVSGHNAVPSSLVSMALLHIGPTVIDPLVEGLRHPSPGVRRVCADLLGMHGALPATRPLVNLVESDEDTEVRMRAANALGRIGAPQGIEPLQRALGAQQPQPLRVTAAFALGQIGGATAIGALHNCINDQDEELGAIAAEALAGMGVKGIAILDVVAQAEGPGRQRAEDWLARSAASTGDRRRRRATGLPPAEQWR